MSSDPQTCPRPRALLLAGSLCLWACVDADEGESEDAGAPACVEIDYEGCALLYPPTWDQVWQQTVNANCSGGGAACHEGDERLRLVEPDQAYVGLTDAAHPLVVAGDPACSPLMIRLESDDPGFRMPPGATPLAEGARCSIATWIADGATQD